MAQNKDWGPALWTILHTAAEHLGKPRHPINQTDEANTWMLVLKYIEPSMPCPMCREHYRAWLGKQPISQFTALRGPALREAARKWVFWLHEEVNKGRGIVSGLTLHDMPKIYSDVKIYQSELDKFISFSKVHIQYNRVKVEDVWKFRQQIHYLRKISDSLKP